MTGIQSSDPSSRLYRRASLQGLHPGMYELVMRSKGSTQCRVAFELQSTLLKECYIGIHIGDYYRGYEGGY